MKRRWLPLLATAALAAVGAYIPASAATAAPAVSCSDVAATEVAATQLAKSCSRDVAVESSRSEYAQVVAHADGRLTFESAVVPQRAKQADGRWADVDLTLRSGKGGLLRPGVSIADVAFSPGGTGPLATVKRDGKTFTMSWPGKLPAPSVSGDSATYANVLSGVDLVVRATRTGFTHVLVVKTPAAAALVKTIRFGLGGDAKVTRAADGSLRAMAGNTVLARAKPAMMWDSAAPLVRTTGLAASTARSAGDTARVRPIKTEIAGRDLVLRPDVTLLSAATAYPVYVDPDWEYGSGGGQKWAYATNNNETNTDYATARVGRRPDNGTVYRSFFEFPLLGNTPTGQVWLHGKDIRSAYVQMYLTHSSKCTDAWTYMYLTPAINATMKASWSSMGLSSYQAAAYGHANEAGGCGVTQPDMTMNFFGNMTALTQQAANENWQNMTLGFAGRDTNGNGEGSNDSWMKYIPDNAKLVVEYNSKPGMPTGLQVAGVACPSDVLSVGSLTPTLSAEYPDADSGQTLSGAYEWIEVPSGGIGTVTDSSPSRLSPTLTASATANGRAWTSALPTIAKNKKYAYRVRTTDPYSAASPWSGWCQFEVDTTAPQVSVSMMAAPAGPGEPGSFKITSTSGDVTRFKYGWGAATTEVAASGSPKSTLITLTAPKFGKNILFVSAVDATGNEGFGSVEFAAGRPTPAVARWGLETYPGVTQPGALADQQPALSGDTPLTPAGVSWADNSRLVGGKTAHFDGAAATAMTTGTATANSGNSFSVAAWVRLDDNASYRSAVSGEGSQMSLFRLGYRSDVQKWCFILRAKDDVAEKANLTKACGPAPVLGRWTHLAGSYDEAAQLITIYVDGVVAGTAPLASSFLNVWGTGQPAAKTVVGRALDTTFSPAAVERWIGDIADVQVFGRVLVPQDFTGALAADPTAGGFNEPGILTPTRVGQWDFNSAVSCYVADVRDTCESPDGTGWNRWMALSRGSAAGAGRSTSDGGLWLDNAYFPEDGNTETGTLESGRSAYKTGLTLPDENGLEFTTWQDSAVVRTDQSFTVSTWVNPTVMPGGTQTVLAQDGGTYVSGFYLGTRLDSVTSQHKWTFTMHDADVVSGNGRYAKAINPITSADLGRWTHLTAVYDAPRGELRLYINGVKQSVESRPAGVVPWHAGGAFTVGRASYHGSQVDYFTGAIDDVQAFQGAMSDVDVAILHSGLPASTVNVVGDGNDTIGTWRPSDGTFRLRNTNNSGLADTTFGYGSSALGDLPLIGDWNGDGIDTVGVWRGSNQTFYLRNTNTQGNGDLTIPFGSPGDTPVVGDWNGDGIDTVGVWRAGTFYLANSNTSGTGYQTVAFGSTTDKPFAGDWNGDGVDTIGVWRDSSSNFYLSNTNAQNSAYLTVSYGNSAYGDKPLAGDWNGDGIDTVGIWRPGSNAFHLRNSNTGGNADYVISFGAYGDIPLVGDFSTERSGKLADWVGERSNILAQYGNTDGSTSVLRLPRTGDQTHGAPVEAWRSAAYPAANTRSVAGDFNGDGIRDVALIRDVGGSEWRTTLLAGRADGGFTQKPETGHGYLAGMGVTFMAGDANGDGRADLLAYHNDGGNNFRMFMFPAKADGSGFGAFATWYTLNDGTWNWAAARVVAGDFNGDGLADVAAFYDWGGANTAIFMFRSSNKTSFTRTVEWSGGANNWAAAQAQYSVGDLNGDGRDDIVAAYDYGNATTSMWGFISQGTSWSTPLWWSSGAGNWNAAATKLFTGDYNGDGRDDLGMFYGYGPYVGVLGLVNNGQSEFIDAHHKIDLPSYDWTKLNAL